MLKNLIIIGAGNVGGYISYNIHELGNYELLGFLDDDHLKQDQVLYGKKVLGRVSDIDKYLGPKPLSLVIGIANPNAKRKIVAFLKDKNVTFPNFLARNVWLSKHVSVGTGVIIYPGVSINYETVIEDFVIINMNCAIGHNCRLSLYSTLAPGVNLAGFTKIGQAVDMGIGTSTRQGVNIGNNSLVGGQSMLIENVAENSRVKGVPAKEF